MWITSAAADTVTITPRPHPGVNLAGLYLMMCNNYTIVMYTSDEYFTACDRSLSWSKSVIHVCHPLTDSVFYAL